MNQTSTSLCYICLLGLNFKNDKVASCINGHFVHQLCHEQYSGSTNPIHYKTCSSCRVATYPDNVIKRAANVFTFVNYECDVSFFYQIYLSLILFSIFYLLITFNFSYFLYLAYMFQL